MLICVNSVSCISKIKIDYTEQSPYMTNQKSPAFRYLIIGQKARLCTAERIRILRLPEKCSHLFENHVQAIYQFSKKKSTLIFEINLSFPKIVSYLI